MAAELRATRKKSRDDTIKDIRAEAQLWDRFNGPMRDQLREGFAGQGESLPMCPCARMHVSSHTVHGQVSEPVGSISAWDWTLGGGRAATIRHALTSVERFGTSLVRKCMVC
jgi:hypothetical protein